jgi:hypothetical protein
MRLWQRIFGARKVETTVNRYIDMTRLEKDGIDLPKIMEIIDSVDEPYRRLFVMAVFGGNLEAELEHFPKRIYTRREIIILGKVPSAFHRLHDIAQGLPDIVMVPHSLEHPELYGGSKIPDAQRYHYWMISKRLIAMHHRLVRISYLSHFPKFEINFEYQDGAIVYSGERTGTYDIHFLSLGYEGEGPRYARVFLAAAGFHLSADEIASIRPNDTIQMMFGKPLIIRGGSKR